MQNVVFEPGQTIFSEGDPSTMIYKVLARSVDIVIRACDGQEQRIATVGPDEVFGELGIIDPAPRSATVIARGTDGLHCLFGRGSGRDDVEQSR